MVSYTEFGQRREDQIVRQLRAHPHPASGAGSTKGDFTINGDEDTPHTVVELKTVPGAKSHSVKCDTLWNTLRQAERIGGEAMYVIEFDGIKLVGKITRR